MKAYILALLFILFMSSLSFLQTKTKNILIIFGSFSGSTKEIVDSLNIYLT